MKKLSFKIFRIFDIDIKIHLTFFLLILWIIANGKIQNYYFEEIIYQIIFSFAVFFCILLHELGHCLVAKKFKCQTRNIIILPIGCIAQMESLPKKPLEELLVAVAGPLVNVIIAFLIYLYLGVNNSLYYSQRMLESSNFLEINFLFALFMVNIILAIFNLIPAFPMDGGRILRALLAIKLTRKTSTLISVRIGQFIAIIFIFIGFNYNILLSFIGVFIFFTAKKEIDTKK